MILYCGNYISSAPSYTSTCPFLEYMTSYKM